MYFKIRNMESICCKGPKKLDRIIKSFFFSSFFFLRYGWNFTDTHNFTLQHRRESFALCILPYSAAHTSCAPAVCTRTLAERVHRGISDDSHNPDTLAQH